MSWLLFLDKSGHDHRALPYEVRGGVALHVSQLWPFICALRELEEHAFGTELHQFKAEIKGKTVLDKDRFRWAAQGPDMPDERRQRHSRVFLTKGLQNESPARDDFTGYGQACLEWVRGMFDLLDSHKAVIFPCAIPREARKPKGFQSEEFLRKDHVFLLERLFYFLEEKKEHGLLVMDEVEKDEDRRFVKRLERYFLQTQTGRHRTAWIVPAPFFVSSDLTYPVQVADVCIYCINHGFRLAPGMDADTRTEIETAFAHRLRNLQFVGEGYRGGAVFKVFGVIHVPDPYQPRSGHKKRR